MEAQDLIYLLTCAINCENPDPERVAGMDLDAVYRLASRHMLAAAAAPALKAAGVKDDRFENAIAISALRNTRMDMEMEALFAEMDATGIWHLPLKGIILQHLYPVYGMRQMSDHDILFDAARADDVKSIMEKLGFQTIYFDVSNHDVYRKKPLSNFEMHRLLFEPGRDKKRDEYYRNVEKRLRGEGYEKHLSPEDFYIYMIAHENKHYSADGTGLRSLLDTYVYLQKQPLDMAYVKAETEKLGMTAFETANRTLACRLFSSEELTEPDKEMLSYILSSGVYGTIAQGVTNKMRKNGWGKLRYAMSRFFVPLNRDSENYWTMSTFFPFFYKHKIFLPLLPFYRVIRGLKSGALKAELEALKNAGHESE